MVIIILISASWHMTVFGFNNEVILTVILMRQADIGYLNVLVLHFSRDHLQ